MSDSTGSGQKVRFATTRWSRLLQLPSDSAAELLQPLESLVRDYWRPLYGFLRKMGLQPADAEDATQGYLSYLLESSRWRSAHPSRGRFRSFLLASLQNWLANERRSERTLKRGGGLTIASTDFADAEQNWQTYPSEQETPERVFERRWALTLMENALSRVRELYEKSGKGILFDRLKQSLSANDETLATLAGELDLSEAAVRVAIHRIRKRCRDALRTEVARTLQSNDDLEHEVQTVIAWLN